MDRAERQVQVDGQIKSGDRGFHGVKGLRQVIGFVNERYLAELERQLDGAERALEDADRRGRQMANAMTLLQDEHELALTVADLPWGKIDVDGLETKAERIRLQIERIESDPELAQLQDELKQLLRQKADEGKPRYRAEAELENAQHAVQAEQAWLDMLGDSDFDDAALSDMVSNLLADTDGTCFDTSRPQERPPRIAGGFDREGTAPFDVRVLRRIGNTVRARLQQIDARAVQLRAATERAMGDYLKHHSSEGVTVMASVEDYPYFLDELKNLNMLVTRAATDEEYANSVEKLYMSFQQLNRAFNTDEENVREQLDRIKRLGVVPSFFVVHTYFWGDRHYDMFLGQDRAERISPLRSALKRGIPFSNHNDTFVTPIDPLLSVWSAVNRLTSSGQVLGEEYTISVMDALRSVTSWAAYQACEETSKGSLEPGKLADFVILEANPLTVAKETIKDIGISATIVGDEVVYGSLD